MFEEYYSNKNNYGFSNILNNHNSYNSKNINKSNNFFNKNKNSILNNYTTKAKDISNIKKNIKNNSITIKTFQKSSGNLNQSSFDYKNKIKRIKQNKSLFPNHLFIYNNFNNNINNISNNNIKNHKNYRKNNIRTVRFYNFKTEENESNNNEKISLKSTFISK